MAEWPVQIALAGEDQVHQVLATALVDKVLVALAPDYFDLDSSRGWYRLEDGSQFYKSKNVAEETIPDLCLNGRRVSLRGHINGEPVQPHTQLFRNLILWFASKEPRPELLVILSDSDGDLKREKAAKQALRIQGDLPDSMLVVIGVPHQDAESWLVATFTPATPEDNERVRHARKTIGFSPHLEPHRLTGSPNDAATDAKRVLRFLMLQEGKQLDGKARPPSKAPDGKELELLLDRYWKELAHLKQRGSSCGLTVLIAELQKVLPIVFRDYFAS
jgi:hypothetical protein